MNLPKDPFYGVVGTCKRTGYRFVIYERIEHPEGFTCHVPVLVAAGFGSGSEVHAACNQELHQVLAVGGLPGSK